MTINDDCSIWQGADRHYQEQAALALIEAGAKFWPWCWIVPSCGAKCLNPEHLRVHQPQRLEYPTGVCVYCGDVAWTRDHLVPRTVTGDQFRKRVLTVPACSQCNSFIGDAALFSITERRELALGRLRKRHAKALRRVDYTDAEIAEFGPGLRATIRQGLVEKRAIERRLSWPHDTAFDLRAMGKSGIDDPYALGLLKNHVWGAAA